VLQHLARRGSAWPEASAAAIRDLRSRMIQRQSEALQVVPAATVGGIGTSRDREQSRLKTPSASANAITLARFIPRTGSIADYGLPGINQSNDEQTGGTASTSGIVFPGQAQGEAMGAPRHRSATFDDDDTTFDSILQGDHTFDQGFGSGNLDALDPFSGFDIPFWFEQDQHWDIFQDFN